MELQKREAELGEESWLKIPPELSDGLTDGDLSKRQLRRWTLVLEARQIPCRHRQEAHQRQLLVPADYFQAALLELRRFEEENRNWPPPLPDWPDSKPPSPPRSWIELKRSSFW